jgi:flagellar motility protein MotE (MotC chaperone)
MSDDADMPSKKSFFSEVKSIAGNTAQFISQELKKSDLQSIVSHKADSTRKAIDELTITKKVSELQDYTSDRLDVVSGKKIMDLVEERLELQSNYNDIMASKIIELLERVKHLENENRQHKKDLAEFKKKLR